MMQDGGQTSTADQLQVVPVETVPDEHVAAAVGGVERIEDGLVAAADGVDRLDAGVPLQGLQGRLLDGDVEAVGIGLLDQGPTGREAPHGGPETDLAFLLAPE